LLHSLAKTHASFDDPNLVSHAGLAVPVMALAQRAGLGDLAAEHVTPVGEAGLTIAGPPCDLRAIPNSKSESQTGHHGQPETLILSAPLRIFPG
jgi:hypothetical protein